jgi:hypothetical protein
VFGPFQITLIELKPLIDVPVINSTIMNKKTTNSMLILLAFIPMNFCFGQSDNSTCSPVVAYTPAPAKTKKVEASSAKQNINKLNNKKRRKGNWEFYWDDTNISSKGKFRNGKQVGTWKYYSQAGKLERIEKNKLFGRRIKTEQYYPNGKMEKCGMAKVVVDDEYINYYWTGDWKCYDEAGNFVKIEKYVNGELVE